MRATCEPERRSVMIPRPCPMPAIGAYGPGRFTIWMWAPVLLIDPLLDAGDRAPAWLAWSAVLATFAAFTLAVFAAYSGRRPGDSRPVVALLAVQAAVTFAAAAHYGDHWFTLFALLALAFGSVAPPRWAHRAILLVTVLGALVTWWRSEDWTQTWVTALTTFLAGFGTYTFHRLLSAIAELNRTREELARRAVDQERLRFSRDLHDLLGHTLSVIVVKAEVIRRVLPADTGMAAAHATDIESIGRQSLAEVREAVTGYREADVARELDRSRIALDAAGVELRVERHGELAPPVDALFGWVVREATTNVIRHSGARSCTITVSGGDASAVLTVADDGDGGPARPGAGEGIRGLRERAEALGGRLEATRSRRGFTLRVEAPTTTEGTGE
ncbi:histidine kinase [Phytomonospora sp. NPDC050363]|uniref:sensor histidine kinase n=1 Tax=Phytomonospora sp. NPDC050363 TaxID=3155642 RepID=UPI0033D56874